MGALLQAGARVFIPAPYLDLSLGSVRRAGLWNQNALHELAARGQDDVFDLVVKVAGIDAVLPALSETDRFGRTPAVVACEAGYEDLAAKIARAQGSDAPSCVPFSPSTHATAPRAKVHRLNGGFGLTDKATLRSLLGDKEAGGKGCKASSADSCATPATRVPRISLKQAADPNVFLRHFYSLNRPVLLSTAGGSSHVRQEVQRRSFRIN